VCSELEAIITEIEAYGLPPAETGVCSKAVQQESRKVKAFAAALLLLYCCFTAALLLLYCCFT